MVCHLSWKLLSDKANPMNIVVDPNSFPSIYKSLSFCLEKASDSDSESDSDRVLVIVIVIVIEF